MSKNEKTVDSTESRSTGLNSLRLTREVALEAAILAGILIIAVVIRTLPIRYGGYYTGYDPFFQYRATEYIAENGFFSWYRLSDAFHFHPTGEWHDTLSWYPQGRNIGNSAYPGVPLTAAFVYSILKAVGTNITVYDVGLFFPVLMAMLTCYAMFFLGKDLGGRSAGFLSAFFLAISSPFIRRTSLAFFDTENIGIFGMIVTSLFFLRSIEAEKKLEYRAIYGILSGLTLGYLFASWGAGRYLLGVVMLYMLVSLLRGTYETRHLISYSFTIGLGFLIAGLTPRLGFRYLMNIENLAAFLLVLGLFVYEFIREKLKPEQVQTLFVGMVALVVVVIIVLPFVGLGNPISAKFLRVLNPFTRSELGGTVFDTVAENKVPIWATFFNDFGVVIMLSVYGVWLALQDSNENKMYAALFFLSAMYFAGNMVRLTQILAAPVALLGAFGLSEITKKIVPSLIATEPQSGRRRRRRQVFGVSRWIGVVYIVFIFLTLIPTVMNGVFVGDSPTSLAASAVPVTFDNKYPKDWQRALDWIEENVADDEVVCSWWDYGYWITSMTGKITMADGATQYKRQLENIGMIMMSPQNESIQRLSKYEADYILVFYTFNPNYPGDPRGEWPFGDNGKWHAMASIAGLDPLEYLDLSTGIPNALFEETAIYNLMHQTADPQYFELKFASVNEYVMIYKIHYDSIGSE